MRKVLSFVLVLSLVMGSFSMAFAASSATGLTDLDDQTYAEAANVLVDLGVVTGNPDKTFGGDKPVTRAEMATMIGQALGLKEAGSNTFKDAKNHWGKAWIGIAQSMGVVTGYPDGTFKPDGQVTYYEALSMLCKALGYDDSSLSGTWPNKYIVQAQKLGITENVALSDTAATKGDIAILIYNTLDCAIGKTNSDGVWKADYIDGREIAGNEVTLYYLLGAYTAADQVIIGDENSSISLASYVGKYVKPVKYRKAGDQKDYIIAIKEVLSTTIKGDSYTTGSAYKLTDKDDQVYTFTTADVTGAAYILNGEDKGLTMAKFDSKTISGTSSFEVKLSGSKIEKIYSAVKWSADEVVQFSTGMLDGSKLNGLQLPTNVDKSINYDKFILNGVDSLDKIEKDNVVSIFQKGRASSADVVRVDVGTKTVEGKVTAISSDTDDADKEYTIAGTKYGVTNKPNGGAEKLDLASTVVVYLDYAGNIAFFEESSATAGNYAILITTAGAANTIDDVRAKVLTKEGNELVLSVKSDVVASLSAIATEGCIVSYSTNKDGKIDKIEPKTTLALGGKQFNDAGTIYGGKSVASGIVIFTFDGKDYGVSKIANVKKTTPITSVATAAGYVMSSDGSKIEAMLMDKSLAKGAGSVYAVINDVSPAVNADGDEIYHVVGLVDGKDFEADTDDKITALTTFISTGFTTDSALYALDVDGDGIITDAVSVHNATAQADLEDAITQSGVIVNKVNGKLLQVTGGAIDTLAGGASFLDDEDWVSVDSAAYVYIINDDGDAYEAKSAGSIRNGYEIQLYQISDKSEQYDIVIVTVRP